MSQEQLITYQSALDDIRQMIINGRNTAYQAVNAAQVMTYWNIGKRIVEQEQHGADRAEYGSQLLAQLAGELTAEFGSGFSERQLRYFRQFYMCFPDPEIWNACVPNLSWTHFRSLLRVSDEAARIWYLREAAAENWSARTLDRNIGTQY